jgi:uncharacterized membrane protein YeaQ/YmgE (transglycosylase-associated protein family)
MSELPMELLIGAVAGGLSRYGLPGRNPGGLVAAVMVGVAGALLAGFIGPKTGWYREDDLTGWIMCGVGALLVLAIFRFLSHTTADGGARENYDL